MRSKQDVVKDNYDALLEAYIKSENIIKLLTPDYVPPRDRHTLPARCQELNRMLSDENTMEK